MHLPDVISSRKAPFEAVIIRKSGGKLLMNLVYYLDHGEIFADPLEIESEESLKWTRIRAVEDETSLKRIALFRHPHQRFFDFYFEKIYFEHPKSWKSWRQNLERKGFDFEAGSDVKKHHANANLVLDVIEDKISRFGLYDLPDQIAPQVKFVLAAQDFGFQPINFANYQSEIPQILEEIEPNIATALLQISEKLKQAYPMDSHEMMRDDLAKRVKEIYAIDFDFFEAMRYGTT